MYNFKEKKKHLEELSNAEAAKADLLLLQQAQPSHPSLRTFRRNPQRYAQDILYALLDFRTRDEIRAHRREYTANEEQLSPGEETPSLDTDEPSHESGTDSGEETLSPDTDDPSSESEELKNMEEQLQEAVARADQTEEEKEALQDENESLKEELESEQEAREQAEEALETEKKKPKKPVKKKNTAPRKSKNTKNTPK